MTLEQAHRGYEYQDLLVAIRLVDVALGAATHVWVDKKLVDDDRFDDLTVLTLENRRRRTQFKHREDASSPLPTETFTTISRDLRLDHLVAAAIADRDGPGSTAKDVSFRIVLADARPTDPALISILKPADPDPGPFAEGMSTARLRFSVSELWPPNTPQPPAGAFARVLGFLRSRDDLAWLCERLVVEVGSPSASFDLRTPGPAEQILLGRVIEEIGAGAYPNQSRAPADVAAAFIGAARAARQNTLATVSAEELLSRARVRRDFGAVAAAHPVEEAAEVPRASAASTLRAGVVEAAALRVPLVVVAPPGHGKSWASFRLIANLEQNQWLVADHYCFLSASDEERDARVALDSLLGSLLARLAERDHSLVAEQRPRYTATNQQLVDAVTSALSAGAPGVALIVDGIDHVTRVLGVTTGRADPSTAVADALSSLELPAGAVLVVLSQPGDHLAPLLNRNARLIYLDDMSDEELALLAERGGLIAPAIDEEARTRNGRLVAALAERTKGNALYATYLLREAALKAGNEVDHANTIQALPAFDGSLHSYYEYIVSGLDDSVWVADVIAMLPFAVTVGELYELSPALPGRVDRALRRLKPLLREKAAQGGIRIYHESFARYLQQSGGDVRGRDDLRTRLVSWLAAKGLFEDPRAFRFLLPMLASQGRHESVVELIDNDYAAHAVGGYFPTAVALKNLAIGAASALRTSKWSDVLRCIELARAIHTYEDERLEQTMADSSDVAIRLVGADRVAARMLDDGIPCLPPRIGITLCAAVDVAGGSPPWTEYLAALGPREARANPAQPGSPDLTHAIARGLLRTATDDATRVDAATWAARVSDDSDDIVSLICDVAGPEIAQSVLGEFADAGHAALGLAEWAHAHGTDPRKALRAAVAAGIAVGDSHRLFGLVEALDITDIDLPPGDLSELRRLTLAVQEERIQHQLAPLYEWLDQCAAVARYDRRSLSAADIAIVGPGWYRCWLRFVLALCAAETVALPARSAAAAASLELLKGDVRPFVGTPRACDLHYVRPLVEASILRAFAAIDVGSRPEALRIIRDVGDAIRTTLFGESGGPITRQFVTRLAADSVFDGNSDVGLEIAMAIESDQTKRGYCHDIAIASTSAARAAIASGDDATARAQWLAACRMLVGYGFRKDVTVFELLEPIRAIGALDQFAARQCLESVHSLCLRVLLHTDGKETRGALTEWHELLAALDPVAAAELVAAAALRECNVPNDRHETARMHLWRANMAVATPIVAAALRLTIDDAIDKLDADNLRRIASGAGDSGLELLSILAARADERPTTYSYTNEAEHLAGDAALVADINSVVSGAGLPRVVPLPGDRPARHSAAMPPTSAARLDDRIAAGIAPVFGGGMAGVREILRHARDLSHRGDEGRFRRQRHCNAIGFRLLELANKGLETEVESALEYAAETLAYAGGGELLFELAEGLEARECPGLAAFAYALSWTSTRGWGGWGTFGGETNIGALQRAVELNADGAARALEAELRRLIQRGRGSLFGVTRALLIAIASGTWHSQNVPSRSLAAVSAWRGALSIVNGRMPRLGDDWCGEPRYMATAQSAGKDQVDDALALCTFAAIARPGREQKRRALVASGFVVGAIPGKLSLATATTLELLSEVSSATWFLAMLEESAGEAFALSLAGKAAARLRELAATEHLVVRSIARRLSRRYGIDPPSLPIGDDVPGLCSEVYRTSGGEDGAAASMARKAVGIYAGRRIAECAEELPGLALALERSVAGHIDGPEFRGRLKSQLDALTSRSDPRFPDAVLAHGEAVEEAIQRVCGAARLAKAKSGEVLADPEMWEDALSRTLLGEVGLANWLERLRVARPDFEEPARRGAAVWRSARPPTEAAPSGGWLALTTAVGGADSAPLADVREPPGWRVLAFLESRTWRSRSGAEEADLVATRCAALELREAGCRDGLGCRPFGNGKLSHWFAKGMPAPPLVGSGPLVGLAEVGPGDIPTGIGWVSSLLTPLPWLVAALRLSPGDQPFELVNESGPVLRLRHWRARYTDGKYEQSRPTLQGNRLVISDSAFEALRAAASQCVWREFLGGSPGLADEDDGGLA